MLQIARDTEFAPTQLPTRKELLEVSSRPSTYTSSPYIHRGMKGVEKYRRTWVVKDKGKAAWLWAPVVIIYCNGKASFDPEGGRHDTTGYPAINPCLLGQSETAKQTKQVVLEKRRPVLCFLGKESVRRQVCSDGRYREE
ncbi:hypothetical protein RUM43_014495, partial [Polyplax serrata]